MNLKIDGSVITVSPVDDSREARALWGLTRSLVNNMVVGVGEGFTRVLEVIGVGYRAEAKGDILHLALGYSKPIDFPIPNGISFEVDKQNRITLKRSGQGITGP